MFRVSSVQLPRLLVSVCFLLVLTSPGNAIERAEIESKLNTLRGIQPTKDPTKLKELNSNMDAVWTFVKSHKEMAIPVLHEKLSESMAQKPLDQFFLLDIGFLLYEIQGKEGESLAIAALHEIDPQEEIIQFNFKELFDFTHAVSKQGNSRILPEIDRLFLTNDVGIEAFDAPHYSKLSAVDLCALLYGATSTNAERYLTKKLSEPNVDKNRILEILIRLGSESSVDAVAGVLEQTADYEIFTRGVKMLMEVGGPSGRDAVARMSPSDQKAKDYLVKILPAVKAVSYQSLLARLKRLGGSRKHFSGEELKRRLQRMYQNYGVDDETNPSDVVASSLPTDYLLGEMKSIRCRMFHRANTHALDDVAITNEIINALQFKK